MGESGGGDPVPKLPRGRWFGPRKSNRSVELVRIGMVGILFVVILVLGRPCADGMARFVESFSPPPDAGAAAAPVTAPAYERLTEDQIKERFKNWDDGGAAGRHE